ncbi:aminopeptidase [Pseudescherichia vulneris]
MAVLTAIREWMTHQRIDAMLITSKPNKLPHLGFSSSSGYVLITRQHAHILVDFRYYSDVAARTHGYQLHRLGAGRTMPGIVNQIAQEEGLQRLGFEGEHVSWQTGCDWQEALHPSLVSVSLDALRQVKTADEIQLIREACRIADATAEHIRRFIQPGMREREVAAELEWFMKQQGAEKPSFDTIVASGPRGALPHGKASEKVIIAGELVTLDFGAQYQGYCSDITRTFLVAGRFAQPEMSPLYAVYQTVLEAQLAAIAAVRPGVVCHTVDAAAREHISRAGYGPNFGHNTGHAIGIDVHENPRFSPTDATLLRPGMLLTVEPGIYLEGEGGVRIEDVVLVTDSGAEVLYQTPKTLLMTGEA